MGKLGARLLRVSGFLLVAGFTLACVLLLVLRHLVFPHVDEYRADIAAALSRELGQPVEIAAIRTGWDGWNPKLSVEGLRVRDGAAPEGPPLIDLPEVGGTISWTSLLFGDLRLRELTLDRPRLAIRRDAEGRFQVAGIMLEQSAARESTYTDWLMRQRLVVVRDALVTWEDASRNAPQLLLNQVQFRLENRFSQHRFGLTGVPPAELAAPIDVKGEFSTAFLEDWRKGRGRLYLRLDRADIAAWSKWLPMPAAFASGTGALRLWFEFGEGETRDAVADVELAEVRTQLADDLAPLELKHLAGRMTWQQEGRQRTFSAQGLRFVAADGTEAAPANFNIRYVRDSTGETTSGQVALSMFQFAPLVALAAYLPLPQSMRRDLTRYAPRGTLGALDYEWAGPLDSPTRFAARGTFTNVGINASPPMPGLSGWSGSFKLNQSEGSIELSSRKSSITLPKVLTDPVALDTASGRLRWELRDNGGIAVRFDDIRFANAHAAGTTQGSWTSRPGGPGVIDLTARITRSDSRQLHRYIPLVVSERTRHWVRDSIMGGRAEDARLTLKGDLANFPFDGKPGLFLVTFRAANATLDYANGWPSIKGIDADVRFEGHGLTITMTRGQIYGATLGRTLAKIPDLSIPHPILTVTGDATGPTPEFMRFIDTSPIANWIDHYTEGVQASGEGRLGLEFTMPLGEPDTIARVKGSYQFADNTLRFPGIPELAKLRGRLSFTERELDGRELAFETLGGAAQASLSGRQGTIDVKAIGNAALADVRESFDLPWEERFSGTTDWQLDLSVRKKTSRWTLRSSLRGAAIDLPPPLGKRPLETANLTMELRPKDTEGAGETLVIDYGKVGRAVLQQRPASAGSGVDRALVLLGKAAGTKAALPERAGITLRGDVAAVDIDEWLALAGEGSGAQRGPPMPALDQIDLEAGELVAFGRRFDAMKLNARHAANRWSLRFASRQGEGTAVWEPAGTDLANGRLSAKLARLDITKVDSLRAAPEPGQEAAPRRENSANPWPEIDVVAERFIGRAGDLGRMELSARPEATDWRITRFALINEAGRVDADGWWRLVGRKEHTRLDVRMDVKDSGSWLATVGLPDDVKGAPAKLEGQLAWPGSPADFEYADLSGEFRVNVGAGQFTKLDPGMGKLLGVLSLQALPRRINLDFRDVFSEGFAFDSIRGKVGIENGVMRTNDLMMVGPAAKVHLAGEVDLGRETQRLSVRVQPSLSSTVSAAAAVALLAANPLVGAAVGAGTLLAQKIMQDPIEQIFSYEYAVRGSWSEPLVERVSSRPLPRTGEGSIADSAVR